MFTRHVHIGYSLHPVTISGVLLRAIHDYILDIIKLLQSGGSTQCLQQVLSAGAVGLMTTAARSVPNFFSSCFVRNQGILKVFM